MLNELLPLLSRLSCENLRVDINRNDQEASACAAISLKNGTFTNPAGRGITIEELSATVENLLLNEKQPFDLKTSHITLQRILVRVSQHWLNDTLKEKHALYEEPGLRDLEIICIPGKLIIRGSYKKGVSFPFSIEIKTGVQNNRLVIELAQFNLMEFLPLPPVVQNTLMDIFKKQLSHKFVEMDHHKFHIDLLGALDAPLSMILKSFRIEKECVVLEV